MEVDIELGMPEATLTRGSGDPSHDFLRSDVRPLDSFFVPQSIAVIGATEKPHSVGRTVLANLLNGRYQGAVYPVTPAHPSVLGVAAYPNIAAAPGPVDMAVIVTPAPTVPGIVGECVDAGVRAAVVISAGFKEKGPEGAEFERQITQQLRRGSMRLIGPNCLGVMNPSIGLNATFAANLPRAGSVAFVSQSGALLAAILDWSLRELVGFSAFVSTGSMLDVSWGDLIYHLGDDPRTQSIVLYMESIGDARTFLSAAREVALTKPIIVIKAGRTEAAARAAASHTGSLTGSDEVLEAAFRRSGVLRVNSIAELFYMADVLGKQPRPRGPRLTIITNAGGPGVLATDALIGSGGELAVLSDATIAELDKFLPSHWSRANPIDLIGDATPERYARAVELAAADPGSDGVLTIIVPQGMTDPAEHARQLVPYAKVGKPMLASLMGGPMTVESERLLNEAGIPTFAFPDTAARMFQYMWAYTQTLHGLYETPVLAEDEHADAQARQRAREIIADAYRVGRTLLTEHESKQLLHHYGIPSVETRIAVTEDEAATVAAELGFPLVAKLHSKTITHKTDIGGVRLGLATQASVRAAFRDIRESVTRLRGSEHFLGITLQPMVSQQGYELIVGSTTDPQFGPVMLFGSGGQLVEIFRDRSLALPPLTTTLARRLMERTRIFAALQGTRGRPPVDLAALERLLVQFSQLIVEQSRIAEVDINPLLVNHDRILALDARIVLHPPGVAIGDLPRPAIRPYPSQYVSAWTMKDGTEIIIRPIRPEDEPLMVRFHQTLSERSVFLRYFRVESLDRRTAHERLTRICFVDYDREMALVAQLRGPGGQPSEILGVGRLSKLHGRNAAEFAVLVSDRWQRRGLGRELLRRLLQIGRDEKLERITASVLPENREMQAVMKQLGFQFWMESDDRLLAAEVRFR